MKQKISLIKGSAGAYCATSDLISECIKRHSAPVPPSNLSAAQKPGNDKLHKNHDAEEAYQKQKRIGNIEKRAEF